MALAARQRRIMQKHLGAFHAPSHGHWLIETDINPNQNRLTQDGCGCYHMYLVSHQCLELALGLRVCASARWLYARRLQSTWESCHMEVFLQSCSVASNVNKRHGRDDLGLETVRVPANSVLLVKALELVYISRPADGKRLLSQQSVWGHLLQEVSLQDIQFSLRTGIRTSLEHLRALDVERNRCDRADGDSGSAQFNIWIWLRVVWYVEHVFYAYIGFLHLWT